MIGVLVTLVVAHLVQLVVCIVSGDCNSFLIVYPFAIHKETHIFSGKRKPVDPSLLATFMRRRVGNGVGNRDYDDDDDRNGGRNDDMTSEGGMRPMVDRRTKTKETIEFHTIAESS